MLILTHSAAKAAFFTTKNGAASIAASVRHVTPFLPYRKKEKCRTAAAMNLRPRIHAAALSAAV